MIEVKAFEVRDEATFIPALAIRVQNRRSGAAEDYLLGRAGWSPWQTGTYLMRLEGGEIHYSPYEWGSRTMGAAHEYIDQNWDDLLGGAVVDAAYLLGLRNEPCESEMVEATV